MAVNRFATNNLVAEHDIYVKYLEIRKKFIEEHNWTDVKEFVPSRCGLFENLSDVPPTTIKRGLYKWHCMMLSYDIWKNLVKSHIVWKGAIEYKKSVNVSYGVLKRFKYATEQAIHEARCDYNRRLPHNQAQYDACRYLAMYWTYLDIIKDDKTQRYYPDAETREIAAKVFGYKESENPFVMNGTYWAWSKKDIEDTSMEETKETMEEKNYSKDWFSTLLVDIIDDARLTNPLWRANIRTVGDFVSKSDKELLKTRTFGVVKLRKVKEAIEKDGKKYIIDNSEENPEEKTYADVIDRKHIKETVGDIVNRMNEEEKKALSYLVGCALEENKTKYDALNKKYDELLKTAQEQADKYDKLLEQKLECEAHNSRLRDENANLKDENEGLKSVAESRRIASNPKNFDTFALLNIVLEKMKDSKTDNIFITVDGMTIDIHKKFEHPFGKADSYTIRTREAR